jgi:hypothetical protein
MLKKIGFTSTPGVVARPCEFQENIFWEDEQAERAALAERAA